MSDIDPRSLREELEIRVVALLTGELPEADADELEKILSVDEELSDFRDRMAGLIGDVHAAREEIAPPVATQEMRLSEERRREIFGDVAIQESISEEETKKWWHLGVLEIAAMLIFGGFLAAILIPSVGAVRQEANSGVDRQSEVFFDYEAESEGFGYLPAARGTVANSAETSPPATAERRSLSAAPQTVAVVGDLPATGRLFKTKEAVKQTEELREFKFESDFAEQPQFSALGRESLELRRNDGLASANYASREMREQIVPVSGGARLKEVADRNTGLGVDKASAPVAMSWGSGSVESDELLVAELQDPVAWNFASADSKANMNLGATAGAPVNAAVKGGSRSESGVDELGAVVAGQFCQGTSLESVEVALGDVMALSDASQFGESKDYYKRQQQGERPMIESAPVSSTAVVAASEWASDEQSQLSVFYDGADLYANKKPEPTAVPSTAVPLDEFSKGKKGDAVNLYAAFGSKAPDGYEVDSLASSLETASRVDQLEQSISTRLSDLDTASVGQGTYAWLAPKAGEVAQSKFDADAEQLGYAGDVDEVRMPTQELALIKERAFGRAKNTQQTPKPEKNASDNPISTFSLNVSDVSFKLAQAALNSQRIPEAALIRTEEFVNSFSYGDPAPRGDEAVSLNWEMAQHPYAHDRQIVRFSLQTQAAGRAANQPLNLNLLVDNSGSMQRPDRRAILEKSLESLQAKLTDQDQLNVIVFARQPKLIANANTVATQQAAIEDALNYQPQGGTNLEAGLQVAYQAAQANYNPAASNRVILMTDGAANLGDVNAEALAAQVIDNRKQGVALDAYGIGWEDYNDALLEEITRNGDGRYAFLNSIDSAADDFAEKLAGTLRVAAADVKVQIIWNPERVQTYRQIGYDLHQLKAQDFRDNTVDAAEIGEAESGTALYVLQINDDPEIAGGLGKLQVRYRVPATGEYVEHAWPLEMPHQIPQLNEAPASLQLAATSALFAERLANNPYASNYDFDDIETLASSLPEAFPKQSRVVDLQNMIHSANTLFTRVE